MVVVWVGLVGDDFIINFIYWEVYNGDLDLVVVGIFVGIVMVEVGVNQLLEQDIIEVIDFGYEVVQDLINVQWELMIDLGIILVIFELFLVNIVVEEFIVNRVFKKIIIVFG